MNNRNFIAFLEDTYPEHKLLHEHARKLVALFEAIDRADTEGYMLPIFVKEALAQLEGGVINDHFK